MSRKLPLTPKIVKINFDWKNILIEWVFKKCNCATSIWCQHLASMWCWQWTLQILSFLTYGLSVNINCWYHFNVKNFLPTGDASGKMLALFLVLVIYFCLSIRALLEVKHALRINIYLFIYLFIYIKHTCIVQSMS